MAATAMGMKRLMKELRELRNNPEEDFVAGPGNDGDIFVWHFTLKGPEDSPFEGGLYHGKIIFPAEYPLKPPDVIFLTPNGRFETNKKICLSNTSYHPESWQPSWSARVILTAIRAFFTEDANGIGALNASNSERRVLALKSRNFICNECSLGIPGEDIHEESESEENDQQNEEKETVKAPETDSKAEEKVKEETFNFEDVADEGKIEEEPIKVEAISEDEEVIAEAVKEDIVEVEKAKKVSIDLSLDISIVVVFFFILFILACKALYC